jgi:hypothetical protein
VLRRERVTNLARFSCATAREAEVDALGPV